MTSARICQQCGKALTPQDRFCPQCGTGQIAAPAPPQPTAGPWDGILDRLARATAPRYRVIRLLGYGGMAGVYLAEEPRLGRRVALKVMAPGLMVDPGLVSRFEQEARTTAQLNHPNIVTIFDVDSRDGLHFFVMAFVPGRTLGQIMSQSEERLPIQAVLHWFAQAGSGLAYAHRAGIVHRDIKPGNILVDGFGNALVTDFGIAKVADEPSLTRTGFLVGTPTYMSPEQCASAAVTGASDQYALGVVLYELLTGQPPFSGPTISVLQAHVTQKPRPVRELRPDCPARLADAIDRMLLKAPDERFPTVAAAITASGAAVLPDDDLLRERLGAIAAVADAVELPAVGALATGEATALDATVRDVNGRSLPNRRVRWVSDTPALLSVNDEGVVHALAPGTGRVTAWCEGVAATAALEITPAPVSLAPATEEPVEAARITPTELFTPTPPQIPAPPLPPPAARTTPPPAVAEPTPADLYAQPSPAATEPTPPPATEPTPPGLYAQPTPPPTAAPTPSAPPPQTPVSAAPTAGAGPASDLPWRSAPEQPPRDVVLPAPARTPKSAKGRRTPLLAGVAALVLVLVAAALLVQRGFSPEGGSSADSPPADPPAGDGASATVPPPVADGVLADTVADDPDPAVAAGDPVAGRQATPPPPAAQATTPPPAPPPAAETPRRGTLRIAGTLPAGAEIRVSGPGADNARITEGWILLAPGDYTVNVRAPGYEVARRPVTIRAGETVSWSPALRAVQAADPAAQPPPPPPATPPQGDEAAAVEAVRGVLGAFVQALESRDLDAIARQYPASARIWSDAWRLLIEDRRNAQNLETSLTDVNTEIDGEVARSVFTLELRFDDYRNRSTQARSEFEATLRRGGEGWTLTDLRQVQQ